MSNSVVLLWSMKLKVLRMVSFGVILSGIFLTFATAIALHYDRVMNMTLCAEVRNFDPNEISLNTEIVFSLMLMVIN